MRGIFFLTLGVLAGISAFLVRDGLGQASSGSSSTSNSTTLSPPPGAQDNIDPGDFVKPKAELPLRESPPGGLFGWKGHVVGTAEPEGMYKVLEERDVYSFIGSQKWLKVQLGYDWDRRGSGWLFTGYNGRDPNQNVTLVKK